MQQANRSILITLVALFVTCLIISNIIAVKLISIGDLVLPAAVILFPLSYILGDVLTEVYGYKTARRTIWLGFFCNLVAVIAIYIGGIIPAPVFWENQPAYDMILGATPRILVASFLAYLAGEFVNAYILARLKVKMQGRHLWVRTIGSTLVGQAIDSAIFMTIAFVGILPGEAIIGAVITQWAFKSLYEALATPLTYWVVAYVKRVEKLDTFDKDIAFNPFSTK